MVTTNRIDLKLVDKVIFNEIFTFNLGVNIVLSDDNTKIEIKPIKALDGFAGDGAIAIAKLICQKLNSKGVYPCRNNGTLELTLQHRKFEVTSLNNSFILSVIDTDVVAVMTENKA
jgi:hypothetical protein